MIKILYSCRDFPSAECEENLRLFLRVRATVTNNNTLKFVATVPLLLEQCYISFTLSSLSTMSWKDLPVRGEPFQPKSVQEDIKQHDQDSPPLEGRFKYHLEIEPDMLRQLDQRLISNEQLVEEVKGIYAGLVMVEAKCIEIDEKQLASAKEKDLCKRVSLQNHQWQSLIALHRQVHTLSRARRSTTYRAAFTNYLSTS